MPLALLRPTGEPPISISWMEHVEVDYDPEFGHMLPYRNAFRMLKSVEGRFYLVVRFLSDTGDGEHCVLWRASDPDKLLSFLEHYDPVLHLPRQRSASETAKMKLGLMTRYQQRKREFTLAERRQFGTELPAGWSED